MCRADFWIQRERERVGWFGRMALKHVYYHVRNKSPVYVQCRIQYAWGWYMGMTQRGVMGREVGGGFMFGNTCTPVVDSCQCMAKPIQYCKVKWSKKINKKIKAPWSSDVSSLCPDSLGGPLPWPPLVGSWESPEQTGKCRGRQRLHLSKVTPNASLWQST